MAKTIKSRACKKWWNGQCKLGDECVDEHVPYEVCWDFYKGKTCPRPQCRWMHVGPSMVADGKLIKTEGKSISSKKPFRIQSRPTYSSIPHTSSIYRSRYEPYRTSYSTTTTASYTPSYSHRFSHSYYSQPTYSSEIPSFGYDDSVYVPLAQSYHESVLPISSTTYENDGYISTYPSFVQSTYQDEVPTYSTLSSSETLLPNIDERYLSSYSAPAPSYSAVYPGTVDSETESDGSSRYAYLGI